MSSSNHTTTDSGSTTPKQRPVGIRSFTLLDVDTKYEPPERPHLNVALIGDLVSLEIQTEEYDAKTQTTTVKRIAGIIVDAEPFWNGLLASVISDGQKPQ